MNVNTKCIGCRPDGTITFTDHEVRSYLASHCQAVLKPASQHSTAWVNRCFMAAELSKEIGEDYTVVELMNVLLQRLVRNKQCNRALISRALNLLCNASCSNDECTWEYAVSVYSLYHSLLQEDVQ